jgi:anti-sigma regulatory factor (Ser/Thr protein kinase)
MAHSSSLHRSLTVDGTPEPVRALRSMLASFLKDRGVPEDVVRSVVLAFAEALDNAMEHGTVGAGEVRVRLRYTPKFILLSLLDTGSDKAPLGRPVTPDTDSERGRGFQLMNKMMHYVRVRTYPQGGTRVSMLRNLDSPPPGQATEATEP